MYAQKYHCVLGLTIKCHFDYASVVWFHNIIYKISIYQLAGLEIISLLNVITSLELYFLTFDLEGRP